MGEYLGFRILVGIGCFVICMVILAGVLYLPEEIMKILGAFLDEVPVIGKLFSSLAGMNQQVLGGSAMTLNGHFSAIVECVAQNALDAAFMGIIYALVSFLVFGPDAGSKRFLARVPCLAGCTVVSVFILYLIKQIPSAVFRTWFLAIVSIGLLLIAIGIMLRAGTGKNGKRPVIRFGLDVLLGMIVSIAGTGILCSLYFLGFAGNRFFDALIKHQPVDWKLFEMWLASTLGYSLLAVIGFVVWGIADREGYND